MKYLLIIGLTLLVSWSIIKISSKKRMMNLGKNKYRQSYIYEITKDIFPKKILDKPKVVTQSEKHIQKNMLRVVITEGKAYWILGNIFYTANAINGRVDELTITPIDTENMPTKELNKMLSILDDLKQGVGSNDSGGTGNKRI